LLEKKCVKQSAEGSQRLSGDNVVGLFIERRSSEQRPC